jgi:succinoglycan biosynthesis protein ExoO
VTKTSSAPITFCVVNYNGADFIGETLAAIGRESGPDDEIVVVDNASSDESVGVIASLDPSARLIELESNLGPGAARNRGFRAARHDLVLFIDNDVILQPGCARLLAQALDDDREALTASPRVFYAADSSIVQYEGANCHFLGLMITRYPDQPLADCGDQSIARNNSIVTACFMIDRSRWRGE